MSIEKITKKITEDARKEAEKIRQEAAAEATRIVDEARAEADKMRHDVGKRGAIEKAKIVDRRNSVADIDSRKMILAAKRELMDQCFDDACEAILSMKTDDYVNFLAGIVTKAGLTSGEVILNERDRKAVGGLLIEKLGDKFTLSDKIGKFAGGLVVHTDKVYMNGTLETYIDEARETMALDVASVLFGGQEV